MWAKNYLLSFFFLSLVVFSYLSSLPCNIHLGRYDASCRVINAGSIALLHYVLFMYGVRKCILCNYMMHKTAGFNVRNVIFFFLSLCGVKLSRLIGPLACIIKGDN